MPRRRSCRVDLASTLPLLADGRRAAMERLASARADVLFATSAEAQALLGGGSVERLLELAPVAVVKRGAKGATVLARGRGSSGLTAGRRSRGGPLRFEIATRPIDAPDTTGAGDAFDAGFLVSWLRARADGTHEPLALQRAALAGHRAAARQLIAPRAGTELRVSLADRLAASPTTLPTALAAGTPVVALESTLISHGLPYPANVDVARAAEAAVRDGGAVPATIAIRDGRLVVGLADADLESSRPRGGHPEGRPSESRRGAGRAAAGRGRPCRRR